MLSKTRGRKWLSSLEGNPDFVQVKKKAVPVSRDGQRTRRTLLGGRRHHKRLPPEIEGQDCVEDQGQELSETSPRRKRDGDSLVEDGRIFDRPGKQTRVRSRSVIRQRFTVRLHDGGSSFREERTRVGVPAGSQSEDNDNQREIGNEFHF